MGSLICVSDGEPASPGDEIVFEVVDGQQRQTTQGLIQAAAALVHWQRGNRRGLLRNWEKARPKLLASAPTSYGLDLAALISAMDGLCAEELTTAPQIIRAISADPMLY